MKKLLFTVFMSISFSTHASGLHGLVENGEFFGVAVKTAEAEALLNFMSCSIIFESIYSQYSNLEKENSDHDLSEHDISDRTINLMFMQKQNEIDDNQGMTRDLIELSSDQVSAQIEQYKPEVLNQVLQGLQDENENTIRELKIIPIDFEASVTSHPEITTEKNNDDLIMLHSHLQNNQADSHNAAVALHIPQPIDDQNQQSITNTPTSLSSYTSTVPGRANDLNNPDTKELINLLHQFTQAIENTLSMSAGKLTENQKTIILKNTLASGASNANAGSNQVKAFTLFDHLLLNHISAMDKSLQGLSVDQDIAELKLDISGWKNRKISAGNTWKSEHEARAKTFAGLLSSFENHFNQGDLNSANLQLELLQKEIDSEDSKTMNKDEYKAKIHNLKVKLNTLNNKYIKHVLDASQNFIAQADLGLITMALRRVQNLQAINYANLYKKAQILVLSSLIDAAWLKDQYINDEKFVQDAHFKTWLIAIRNMQNNQYASNQEIEMIPAIANLAHELAVYIDAIKSAQNNLVTSNSLHL